MRFHFGISFRWKTIKKFLLPFLVGFLAYFGFNGIFNHFNLGFLKVLAYENSNTFYNINIPNYKEQLQSKVCGNTNAYDFINDIINSVDFSSSYYQLNIFPQNNTGTNFTFTFIQSSYINGSNDTYPYALWPKGRYVSGASIQYQLYLQSTYNSKGSFDLYFNNCASNTDLSTLKQNIINYINNNTNFSYADSNVGVFYGSNSSTTPSVVGRLNPYSINNNTSYTTNVWYYYSSFKYKYFSPFDYSSSSNYYKSIHLVNEDRTYVVGDDFDSYYDIYVNDVPTFLGYSDSLNTFYTSLLPSDFSSYNLKVEFNVPQSLLGYYQTPQEYLDNTSFDFVCGGRVNHTDYYTYDTFPCTLSLNSSFTNSKITYIFSNLITSQSLTNYDKLYVTLKSSYLDSSVNTVVYNLSYTYSLGNFFNTSYKGPIYENFHNLPLNFKVYFSSNNSINESTLYVKYYDFIDYGLKFIGFSNSTHKQNLVIGSSILGTSNTNEEQNFISTNVSNNIDTGILIYQENSDINYMNLDLFFNSGLVISFNNTSSNSYYYIDTNGDILSGTFNKPILEDTSKYNISYYTSYVSSFINDLSSSALILSTYTQFFYNSLPLYFQTFLLVMFILACLYFVYLLIKR